MVQLYPELPFIGLSTGQTKFYIKKNRTMAKGLKYMVLIIVGVGLIILSNLLFGPRIISKTKPGDEYYFSSLLSNNFRYATTLLFFSSGIVVGYFWRLSPWLTGLCLIAIFPLTSVVEGTIYKGSHNLIPFEFIIHFLFALPAVIGVYVGKFILKKKTRLENK